MNITLNALWSNTNNFIKTKIAEGLTPLEKKVALIATAFFALATVGYLFYRFFYEFPSKTTSIDLKEKDIPVPVAKHNKNHQAKHVFTPSELDEEEPLDAEDQLEPLEVKVAEVVHSEAEIAIHNADQLRAWINHFPDEALDPSGQVRTLYIGAEGDMQMIKGSDDSEIWLKEKDKVHHSYLISILFHKSELDSKKKTPFAFQDNSGYCPAKVREIVQSTLNELNQLACGAFHIAHSDKDHPAAPGIPKWLAVFDNVTDYPATRLLREVAPLPNPIPESPLDVILEPDDEVSEVDGKEEHPPIQEPPSQSPLDVIPESDDEGSEFDDKENSLIQEPPPQSPWDVKSELDDENSKYKNVNLIKKINPEIFEEEPSVHTFQNGKLVYREAPILSPFLDGSHHEKFIHKIKMKQDSEQLAEMSKMSEEKVNKVALDLLKEKDPFID